MELNAFTTAGDAGAGRRGGLLLGTALAGLVVVVGSFVVDPFGVPFVIASWSLFTGGLLAAVVPGRARSCGLGLAVAGAAPPLVLAFLAWLVVTVGILDGSVRW